MRNLLCVAMMLLVVSDASALETIVIDDDGNRDLYAGPNATEVNMSTHDNGGWTMDPHAFNDTVAYNGTGEGVPWVYYPDGNVTYTFLGLFAGETYDVYAYWYVGTHNAGVANYLVSDGLGVVVVDQTKAPTADIMITNPDPLNNNVGNNEFGFQWLGQVVEDSDGIITVNISNGGGENGLFLADAVAVTSVSEPATMILLGLGGLTLIRRK